MISKINQTIKLNLIGVIIFMLFGLVSNANESEGWIKRGSKPDDYEIGTIKDNERGKEVHFIKSIKNKIDGFGTIMQSISPNKYKGKKVKLTGYIKTIDVKKWAGMWMRVDGPAGTKSLSFDNMGKRPIKGTTKWTKYEIVLDVPEESTNISYGVLIHGSGQAWLDNLNIEIVDFKVKSTSMNNTIGGWFILGSKPNSYEVGIENDKERANDVKYMKSIKAKIDGFVFLRKDINPEKYLGKRVKLSGYVKTQDVKKWAGMLMRVGNDGKDKYKTLSFDNMQNRPIKGTTKWTKYEIVLDVPEESKDMNIGFLINGTGQAWIDDFEIEIVDKSLKSTDLYLTKGAWIKAGNEAKSYEISMEKDSERKNFVGYLKSTNASIPKKGFGTIMQCFVADKYKGKRVRLTGYVKTKEIEKWAGMWMRVDGPKKGKPLSFDNMKERPIKGKSDWTKYKIVLDVPKESTNVCFGVLIYGTGEAWIDDIKFEVVDKTVPVTNMLKK